MENTELMELKLMLSYRRPASTKTENTFIERFIEPFNPESDNFGNRIIRIGTAPIMWSSHTDTVHKKGGRQRVVVKNGKFVLAKKETESNCLGADDTAGVWIMLQLLRARVPGLYVFHRSEESGGLGSKWLAKENKEIFDKINFAIGLDRRGNNSIITHQRGRCCSDEFAKSLADATGIGLRKDSTGVFTDTANYTKLIPECTNLSVGYLAEHSVNESLDIAHLDTLKKALINLDVTKLDVKRSVTDVDTDWNMYGSYYGGYPKSNYQYYRQHQPSYSNYPASPYASVYPSYDYIYNKDTLEQHNKASRTHDLENLVEINSNLIARIMNKNGVSGTSFIEWLFYNAGGAKVPK